MALRVMRTHIRIHNVHCHVNSTNKIILEKLKKNTVSKY